MLWGCFSSWKVCNVSVAALGVFFTLEDYCLGSNGLEMSGEAKTHVPDYVCEFLYYISIEQDKGKYVYIYIYIYIYIYTNIINYI